MFRNPSAPFVDMAVSPVVPLDLLQTCLRQRSACVLIPRVALDQPQVIRLHTSSSSSSSSSSFLSPDRGLRLGPRHAAPWICLASGNRASEGNGDEEEEEKEGSQDEIEGEKVKKEKAEEEEEEVDEALQIDGELPPSSDQFLKQVSSRAYEMRRLLEQSIESSSYDVLEANPWREDSKYVYVLAQEENKILTMRTRRPRSEVERELGLLFPKRGSRRGKNGNPKTQSLEQTSSSSASSSDTRFRMLVEDIREGVLVFEDEEEAAQYCSILEGQGKSCTGVAELEASDVFAMCNKIQALAVLFRRGRTPPLPDRLQLNLKARKRSLED